MAEEIAKVHKPQYLGSDMCPVCSAYAEQKDGQLWCTTHGPIEELRRPFPIKQKFPQRTKEDNEREAAAKAKQQKQPPPKQPASR